jgi:O-antigen ligase
VNESLRANGFLLPRPGDTARLLAVGSILLLVAASLALAAYRYPPPSLGLTLTAGVAMVVLLALAVARYEAAVALGLGLLGIQAIEPAPPDAVLAIVIVVAAITGRFDLTRVPLAVLGSIGALVFLNLLSAMDAVDPPRAAFFFSITLYLAVFAIWLADFVRSERRARIVVLAYLFTATISALLGVLALIIPLPGAEQLVYADSRAQALFKDPNVLGPFMVPIILILLEETLSPRLLHMRRPLKLLLLLILLSGLLLAFSRAAWLNMVLGGLIAVGMIAVRRGGLRRVAFMIPIGAIAIVAGAFVIGVSGSETLLEQRSSGLQGYDEDRFSAQEAGIQVGEEHPLGIGPGQFDPVVGYAAHSTFVRVFAEQGLLGVVALVALLITTLVFAIRNAFLGQHTYGIGSAALLGAWCGMLLNSFFVDTLHWRHFWLVAALIWAGTMRGAIRRRTGADDEAGDEPPPRPWVPGEPTGLPPTPRTAPAAR